MKNTTELKTNSAAQDMIYTEGLLHLLQYTNSSQHSNQHLEHHCFLLILSFQDVQPLKQVFSPS